jgi:hypothetical protein
MVVSPGPDRIHDEPTRCECPEDAPGAPTSGCGTVLAWALLGAAAGATLPMLFPGDGGQGSTIGHLLSGGLVVFAMALYGLVGALAGAILGGLRHELRTARNVSARVAAIVRFLILAICLAALLYFVL